MRSVALLLVAVTAGNAFVAGGPKRVPSFALNAVDPQIATGAAVLVVGAAAAFAAQNGALDGVGEGSSSKKKDDAPPEPEPEPIDVSIPYDAAIELAFGEWKAADSGRADAKYEDFKPLYIAKTVAEVVLKKATRELS